MTLCDTCALAFDERKGWEVLHKCQATGELRPYRVKKCSNYRNYPMVKLGVVCPHCGSANTYERTKEFGRVVLNGIWCGDCGKETIDGSESSTAIKRVKLWQNTLKKTLW